MHSFQDDIRANQKERTRQAIVDAAKALMRQGHSPTVAEAAEAAKVSRATAYRYFPSKDALLLEVAAVTPATSTIEETLARLPPDNVEERLRLVQGSLNRMAVAEETLLRTALRTYLDTWLENRRNGADLPAVREGRRMRWIDQALEPARASFPPATWQRLRCALALTMSMDALVVMKDVCHLGDDEALATLEWAAMALLHAGMMDPATAPSPVAAD